VIAEAAPAVRIHPFPGLRPFEADEDHLFFGRERQIDELLRRLRTARFLAILGTSGCGKSSLVRSGLIPSLHGGAMTRAGSNWRIAILRPGEDPIGNLAAALDAPEALGGADGGDELSKHLKEATLRSSNLGLVECVRQARISPRDNVLILVDQFEELFRFKQTRREQGRDEAVAFVKLLLEASRHRDVPVYVALTLRSDFIGNCLELPELPEAINEGLYLVPRMTRDELRAAIVGPVAVGGAAIAPRLVSRLLNDVGDDPDQLPILQHALMRTWDWWDEDHDPGEPLDLRHYEAIGTMKEALSRHAEEAFGELDERGRAIAEILFRALTELGADGKGTRRPVRLAEVCALADGDVLEVAAVAERFRQPGRSFLMPPAEIKLRSDSVLDLSHESLMRIWGRLERWAEEEGQSAQVYLGLARAAARYESGASALWRDPELQTALNWRRQQRPSEAWAARYDPSWERAERFLEASAAERDGEIAEREASRRRKLRQARTLTFVFAAVALGMLALGVYAFLQEKKAEKALAMVKEQNERIDRQNGALLVEKRRAEEERRQALLQESRAEHEQANAERQTRLTEEQRRIAEIERRKAEASAFEARAKKAEAEAARLDAEGRRSEAVRERQRADELRAQAESSEAEATGLSRLSLSRALTLQVPRLVQKDHLDLPALLALEAYRLNQDNRGDPQDPDLYNALRAGLASPETKLGGHVDAVRALAVGSDGLLITGGDDGKVLRHNWKGNGSPTEIGAFSSGVRSLALNPDGRFLAAGFADGALRLWNLSQPGSSPRELAAEGALLGALAFAPRDGLLASARADGTLSLFDPAKPEVRPQLLDGHQSGRVTSLAFGPNGLLVAGLSEGGALLWPAPSGAAPPRALCGNGAIRSVAVSPDGRFVACGGARGEITLETVAGGAPTVLRGHASSVNSLSFSPHVDALASASSDGTVRLWNLKKPNAQPIVLSGHESWVWTLAFTPNGDQVISGGADRTVRIWKARTDLLAAEVCRSVHRGLTREEWSTYMPKDLPYGAEPLCPAP
jgi:energy-coupling factor transporter ATP-binding protein EcfA2